MFIKSDFVFIHIPKTAGKALEQYFKLLPHTGPGDGDYEKIQHRPLREKFEDIKTRKIFCNVRNPWDWHVSRYFHGLSPSLPPLGSARLEKPPSLRKVLTKLGYRIDLHKAYERFEIDRLFMKKDIFTHYLNHTFSSDLGFSDDHRFCIPNVGHLTYSYFNLCSKTEIPKQAKIKDIFKDHDKLIGTDAVFKMEELPNNLLDFLRTEVDSRYGYMPFGHIKEKNKLSLHRSQHYSQYYNDDTRKLIAEKEKFIIDKFGYEFENKN